MGKADVPVVRRSLYSWIFSANVKLQVVLLAVIVVTVFTRVLPLEMQKRIVNEAIRFREIDALFLYCGLYLAAVVLASGLKYLVNTLQTIIGQRALAEMRKQLYHHLLTLPLPFFRRTQPGMVVAALVNELAAAGDFVGMAVAVPVINVLTLLAFGAYLFTLNPWLALLSLSVYPVVLVLVPWLQRRVNEANKKRVDATRVISNKIGEAVTGIHEIHANGSYRLENRKYDGLVDRLLHIRIVWNLYKDGVKVMNNFFTNLSPFFIFILGGYLTIKGRLDLGALVAFLSAQEKLYDPFKELIDFYQSYQDSMVRYQRTMEYFDDMPEHALEPRDREPYELEGSVRVEKLSYEVEGGIRLLDSVDLALKPGEHLAVVGFSGSGKSTLAQCVGQLYKYTGGRVLIGDEEVAELTKKDMASTVGFVSQSPFIFDGTIRENLLYSYVSRLEKGEPLAEESLPSLDDMIQVLQQTGIFVDVLRFGLNTVLDEESYGDLVERVVRVRQNFQRDFGEELAEYVEFFEEDRYLEYSTVSENLTFGSPRDPEFRMDRLPDNVLFRRFLEEAGLVRPLLELGGQLARQTVDILGNLPPEGVFFEQSPIGPEELESYKVLVEGMKKTGREAGDLVDEDRKRLLELALRFTPARHKMAALPPALKELVLQARSRFREKISKESPHAFSFYERSRYLSSQTILNNILFGKPTTDKHQAQERINQSIIHLLIEEDLLEAIVEIGMEYQVGSKGDKLSGGQRQKLAIARVFLKEPNVLIMDEATSALDNKSQGRIQNLLSRQWKGRSTLISIVHRLDTIKDYDKVAVMKAGRIVEMGSYEELLSKKGILYELIHGKQ